MPPEFLANNSGLSQAPDTVGKAPAPSAPPMPQYAMTTTMRPITGNFQMSSFQVPNASSSANPLSTHTTRNTWLFNIFSMTIVRMLLYHPFCDIIF